MRRRADGAIPIERLENRILLKRNPDRFPRDFMFRLSASELEAWRSQFVISKPSAKMGLRRAPFAFTEHGALMAATVLNSPRAVQASRCARVCASAPASCHSPGPR
jgi:ORF6N domain